MALRISHPDGSDLSGNKTHVVQPWWAHSRSVRLLQNRICTVIHIKLKLNKAREAKRRKSLEPKHATWWELNSLCMHVYLFPYAFHPSPQLMNGKSVHVSMIHNADSAAQVQGESFPSRGQSFPNSSFHHEFEVCFVCMCYILNQKWKTLQYYMG